MVTKTLSAFVKVLSVGSVSLSVSLSVFLLPKPSHALTCENIFEPLLSNEIAIDRLAALDTALQALPLEPSLLAVKLVALSKLTDFAFENPTLGRKQAIEIRELETWAETQASNAKTWNPAPIGTHESRLEPSPPSAIKIRSVERSRNAIKDERDLIPHLRAKFHNFITDLESAENPIKLESHWKLEKIRHLAEVDHSGTFYSVRLNGSYRVVFSIEEGQRITILRLSNTVTHAGH